MFGLFGKRQKSHRDKVVEEFINATTRLRSADQIVQIAVGHGVNMANSMLVRAHSDLASFFALPKKHQLDYVGKLGAAAAELWKKDPHSGLGFDLYKMWLVANIQKDEDLIDQFSTELEWLSKVGNFGG